MYLLFAFARSPNFRKMFHLQIIATSSVFHFGFALKFFVTSVVVLLRGGPVSPTGSWGCYLVGLWTTFFGQGSTLCMAALTLNLAVMLALPLRYVAWSQQGTVFTCFYLLVGGVATAVTAASLWWGDIRVTSDLSCWIGNPQFTHAIYAVSARLPSSAHTHTLSLHALLRCLCCVVLFCSVLCCAVLCCAVLCCAVLRCAVLCCAVLCCAVLCCACQVTLACCAVLCCVVLCYAMV
jgi:hypothetical protein